MPTKTKTRNLAEFIDQQQGASHAARRATAAVVLGVSFMSVYRWEKNKPISSMGRDKLAEHGIKKA